MVDINFNYSKSKYKSTVQELVSKRDLSRYINKVCGNKDVKLNYNFVSKKEQIKMNTVYKEHLYNTDVLTFDLSENNCELTGDVYISLKQIKKNTLRFKDTYSNELNRVMIHAYLHLHGYNDDTKNEQKRMRREENKFLKYINKRTHRSTWNTKTPIYHY